MSHGNPALPNHFHFLKLHSGRRGAEAIAHDVHAIAVALDLHAVAGPRIALLERRVQRAAYNGFSFSVPIVGISMIHRVSPNGSIV